MVDVTTTLNILIGNLIKRFNTLLDCPVRFSGHYGELKIHHFIEYVVSYKRIKCIADDQALQELGHLLTENAHNWWLRHKCHFATWSEAMAAIQNEYSKQRPVHIVYKDIFKHSYDEYNSEEDFINDKYELFNELPDPKPSEKCKLDMIFALFPKERQSKLEYLNVTNIWELKEHIHKLKYEKNNAAGSDKPNGVNIGGVPSAETIDSMNGFRVTLAKENNCVSGETPPEVHTVNDKDPIIKVRRTEDLMPQIKREDADQNNVVEQEEFISTEKSMSVTSTNEKSNNFQIDTDIMNQINNIIDESEMISDSLCSNMQISSVMTVKEGSPARIAFLLNGETTIQAEVAKKTNREASKNNIPIKKKIRCSFCRKYGHLAQNCLKKAKHRKLFPEKFDEFGNLINKKRLQGLSESLKGPEIVVTSTNTENVNSNSNNDVVRSVSLAPATSIIPASVCNMSTQMATNSAALSQQIFISSVPSASTATITDNSSLPASQLTSNHITSLSPIPPTLSHTAALTTKLIAPINGPNSNKQLGAKLRSSNGPSPKCHQCGTVGFYRSICPNCSPIYNCNQYKP